MIKKIALFDIDGTLTRPDGTTSLAVLRAVNQAALHGNKVVLASGRPTFGMLELAKNFNLDKNDGYIISYNGCAIYHVPTGKYLLEHFMSQETVAKLALAIEAFPELSPIYYSNEQIVTTKMNDGVRFEGKLNNAPVYEMDDYPPLTPKVIWAGEPAALDKVELFTREHFSEECTIARSLPCFIEFTPLGIDKSSALEELCELLKHPLSETFACGDGGNDTTMIALAGIGVAMGNARDEVKAVADFIAPDNSEDGVIVAIEKFLLV